MTPSDPLTVRPPRQRRTRETWERILDAGVAILERDHYEGFTIAAVCEAARVSPPVIYGRVSSKDALFMAVYEHGMERVRDDELAFDDPSWARDPIERVVRAAVGGVAHAFFAHGAFLRAVIRRSGVDEELNRRGAGHARALAQRFQVALLRRADEIPHEDAGRRVDACFRMVFGTLWLQIVTGSEFQERTVTEDEITQDLCDMAVRYLLGSPAGPDPV